MRCLHGKLKCAGLPAWLAAIGLLVAQVPASVHGVTVSGRVIVTAPSKKNGRSPVVVWLTPVSPDPVQERAPDASHGPYRLVQKNKQFYPHLLVVPAGATVEFPNLDPFFHNVFSLFEGKRFDLGLYEAGSTRSVKFNRPGISYIFCNIHPDMSAIVLALDTPYYGISNAGGGIRIEGVPAGRYKLQVWQELALPEDLKKLSREITVTPDASFLGTIHITGSARGVLVHKNLYGRDYDQSTSPNPLYNHPE